MKNLFLVLIISLILVSCTDSNKSKSAASVIYTSGGRTSEVLVVISKGLWKSALGDSIRESLEQVPGWLARNEPEYIVTQIPKNAFGSIYQKQRNILFITKAEVSNAKIQFKRNMYAKPQTVVTIKGNSTQQLINAFDVYKTKIKKSFHNNEVTRIAGAYKGLEVKTITDELDKKFGFHMIVPKGFYVANDKADFIWLRRPTADVEEGIFIYTRPYTDTSNFSMQSMIDFRNDITKRHVPGPVENSYMKVSNMFPPMYSITEFKGTYASQLRSLWDVQGYAMGGPFISYTFVDEAANRLITIDGYIKAPKKEKRDLLLHIEAIFHSFAYTTITESNNYK
ncbi:MAG: DUF4837 family protein [Bacteroidales bacterium]|nr:DUF4837 family protein [Bacteroidales bacterium]